MTRRPKTSPAKDLVDIVALLPWWAGIAMAVLSYPLLHGIATQQTVATGQPGTITSVALQSVLKGLAAVGQAIVPLICLAGAGVSAWRRRTRQQLVLDVAQSQASDALDGMTWREFEWLVGEGFRLRGYRVVESGGGGPDGGVDLVLTQGGEKFLVQCKQWRALKVGVDVVRELYGVMAARGATGSFVVTSGRFTADASTFASGRNITLLDGPALVGLIKQVKSPTAGLPQRSANTAPTAAPPSSSEAPACPTCGKAMTRRTAKRGANVGAAFWGCTGYPTCRGTRQIG